MALNNNESKNDLVFSFIMVYTIKIYLKLLLKAKIKLSLTSVCVLSEPTPTSDIMSVANKEQSGGREVMTQEVLMYNHNYTVDKNIMFIKWSGVLDN